MISLHLVISSTLKASSEQKRKKKIRTNKSSAIDTPTITKGTGKRGLQFRNPELRKTASAIAFTILAILQLPHVRWSEAVHNGPELPIQSNSSSRGGANEAHPHRHGYGAA